MVNVYWLNLFGRVDVLFVCFIDIRIIFKIKIEIVICVFLKFGIYFLYKFVIFVLYFFVEMMFELNVICVYFGKILNGYIIWYESVKLYF